MRDRLALSALLNNVKVYQKLHAIMSEVEYIKKDKKNEFHGYSYASEKAIKETLHPLLVKHGVLAHPVASSFETKEVEIDTAKGPRKNLVTTGSLTLRFVDVETGDHVDVPMSGMGEDLKGMYKAVTGAVKYALTTTFLIPTGDDPENDDKKSSNNGKPLTPKAGAKSRMQELKEKHFDARDEVPDEAVEENTDLLL